MNVSSYDVTTGEKLGNFDEHKFALKAVYGEGHHLEMKKEHQSK